MSAATGAKSGLKAALDLALADPAASSAPIEPGGEQLPLLPAEALAVEIERENQAAILRGPGRPKGSKNRKTEDWIDYINTNYGNPMVVLAKAMIEPLDQVRRALGGTLAEADKRRRECAEALLPFMHQKLPQAVELDKGIAQLVINMNGASVEVKPGEPNRTIEIEEFQQVDEVDGDEV